MLLSSATIPRTASAARSTSYRRRHQRVLRDSAPRTRAPSCRTACSRWSRDTGCSVLDGDRVRVPRQRGRCVPGDRALDHRRAAHPARRADAARAPCTRSWSAPRHRGLRRHGIEVWHLPHCHARPRGSTFDARATAGITRDRRAEGGKPILTLAITDGGERGLGDGRAPLPDLHARRRAALHLSPLVDDRPVHGARGGARQPRARARTLFSRRSIRDEVTTTLRSASSGCATGSRSSTRCRRSPPRAGR